MAISDINRNTRLNGMAEERGREGTRSETDKLAQIFAITQTSSTERSTGTRFHVEETTARVSIARRAEIERSFDPSRPRKNPSRPRRRIYLMNRGDERGGSSEGDTKGAHCKRRRSRARERLILDSRSRRVCRRARSPGNGGQERWSPWQLHPRRTARRGAVRGRCIDCTLSGWSRARP